MIEHKTIMIHKNTHEDLKKLGVTTESFDTVIRRLIKNAVSDPKAFHGKDQKTATG